MVSFKKCRGYRLDPYLNEALVELFIGEVVESFLQQRDLGVAHVRHEFFERDLGPVDVAPVVGLAARRRHLALR
jgi:hypothetical protein